MTKILTLSRYDVFLKINSTNFNQKLAPSEWRASYIDWRLSVRRSVNANIWAQSSVWFDRQNKCFMAFLRFFCFFLFVNWFVSMTPIRILLYKYFFRRTTNVTYEKTFNRNIETSLLDCEWSSALDAHLFAVRALPKTHPSCFTTFREVHFR